MFTRLVVAIAFVTACSQASPPRETPDAGASVDARVVQTDAAIDTTPAERYLCRAQPPANAPMPDPPPLPAAGCPTLAPGSNTITSSGQQRQFLLVMPANAMPSERLPVLFMWHWLGGDAEDFLTKGDIQTAADQQRFIAVLPVAKGAMVFGTSFNTRWPFYITQSQSRMNEEFKFFDDMLACVQAQHAVNESCVSSIGVSAGALFNAQLAQARSNRLASFVSLSGGTSASIIKPWNGAARKLPAIVLWGGDGPPAMDGNKDILGCASIGMDFSVASTTLENALADDGHFVIECKHNCGHVEPPFDTPSGESKYAGMWEFALSHPFWLAAGQSPFLELGLPQNMPAWCAIGAGNATPRTGGGCPPAENPCQS